jgi:DNA-binding MarR family transcriptional regulator
LGLSVRQLDSLRALNYLLGDNRTEGIPLKRLAQQMWMSEPAASLLVDKMVKKGFFIRTENPKDRRSVCIRFSEEGEANYKMLADGLRVRWQNLFSRLPEEDVENFQRIIHRLHDEFHTEL